MSHRATFSLGRPTPDATLAVVDRPLQTLINIWTTLADIFCDLNCPVTTNSLLRKERLRVYGCAVRSVAGNEGWKSP